MSFSAEITHFSGYGGGAVENLIAGGTADAFMSEFIPWFRSNVKDLNEITEKDNECFRVTGMDFDLQYDINGENDSRFQRIGETSDYADSPLKMVDYIYDTADGHAFSGYVRITVVIYYDCTNPDFLMMADRSVLLEGESTAVEASIRCNDVPLIGKNVTFDIQSGPGVVNPGNMSTNSAGTATTTFTAGDANAVVRAYYYACEAGNSNLMERTVPIAIAADQFNLTITFEQTTSAYEIYDYFSYSGAVPIGVTNDNGDGTADVEGSNTFEVSGSGSVGDCTTTTEGAVTFTFTGTLVTDSEGKQTLQLIQSPNFSTTKTTNCPDDPPLVNPFLTGGETSSFEIPVENGYTIDQEIPAGPITSHITYILNVSG
jgi:hypothetical protein